MMISGIYFSLDIVHGSIYSVFNWLAWAASLKGEA
jgi:hypothetical protein